MFILFYVWPKNCALIFLRSNRRTLKYLEFLTGGSVNPRQKSSSTLSFSKLNFDSSLLDVREADSDPESQLMMDLIRQEEGRGGRRLKKFTHKMKHLTSSSRNIFNDKYATLMRKIDEHSRSSSSGSRSLSSVIYFPTKNVNMRSESNSMLDVRKPKSWTHHSEPIKCGKHLQRTTHPIVRSVSDDSAMKQPSASFNTLVHTTTSKPQRVGSESSISSQSSPEICSTEQCTCSVEQSLDASSSCLEIHKILDAPSSCLEMHTILADCENSAEVENSLENTNTCILESVKEDGSNSNNEKVINENNLITPP